MEVTRGNFKESLPLVEKSIKAADFLAIDAEFTGLNSGRDVSMFDSPQDYYRTLLNGSSNFLLIQFGLCAFTWDEKAKCYRNDTYNFYVFPRVRPGPERIFLCQSSSLEFLISQGFDFNKLIKDGIPYMTEPVETRLRDLLTERQKLYGTERDTIPMPEEHKQKIEGICKKVQEFLDEKKSDDMEIDRCNAFVRRLVFQELRSKFKKEVVVESKLLDNGNRAIKVTRVKSDSEVKDLESQKKEKEWEDFENAVGFSKVAQMISQSGKLVVGHNMLLDVIHTLNHFFAPIPADYASFKEFVHCMFPWILDTKYMSSLPPFKDKVSSSVLPHLLATLSEPPFKMPEVDSDASRGYSDADEKHHEAGYDAYITGLCFLAMHDHLSRMRGETPPRVSVDAAQLRPFQNKLFLAKTAYQDSSYMNLAGKDPSPPRDHVFHLTFPKQWQRNDITQLFSPYGEITVQFLDDSSALVALSRREQARDVLRALGKAGKGQLITYAEYQRLLSHNDKQWRKPEDSACKATPPSPVWTSRARKNSSSSSNATYIPEKVERTALPEKVDRTLSEKVDRTLPEKVHRTLPEKVDRTLPEKVDRTLPEKVDRTLPEKVDRTLPEKVARTLPEKVNCTLPEKVDRSVSENVERTESVHEKVDPSPGKVGRTRSSSQSCVSQSPGRGGRKRTSSGMFQVEDEEPPPKKPEVARTSADDARSKPEATNGRRKATKTPEASVEETEMVIQKKKKIARFDRTGDATKVVSAFKESDSWD